MTANINPDTGIAYGYIAAKCLHPDLVTELMNEGVNHNAQEAFGEWKKEKAKELKSEAEDIGFAEYMCKNPEEIEEWLEEADGYSDEFWDCYEECEPIIAGTKDNVSYQSSWLGGALNFFIFHSPHVTEHACMASPCVPNAGILDTLNGDVQSYDVPPHWRVEE